LRDNGLSNPITEIFGFPYRFGLPKPISMPLVIASIYFLWLFIINVIFSVPFPSLSNIFFVRDMILIVFFSPIYVIYSEKILNLRNNLVDYFLDEKKTSDILYKSLSRIFSWRYNIVIGSLYPIYYFVLTTKYLVTGYYRLDFYLYRLIAVLGLFLTGAIIYQIILTMKLFLLDIRKLTPSDKALSEGIPPISDAAWIGSLMMLTMVSINLLPSLILGLNPKSTLWYLTSHLIFYLVAIIYFVTTLMGTHRSMSKAKTQALSVLFEILNASGKTVMAKMDYSASRDVTADSANLKKQLEFYSKAKTWPIRSQDLLKFILALLAFSSVYILLIIF